MIILMPTEALQKGLVPVRRMITRGGKTFMTTVYVGSTKADKKKQDQSVAMVVKQPSEIRNVSRATVGFMERVEDVIDYAPDDRLAVRKLLKFQEEYFGNKPKPSIYDVVQMATEEVEYALSQTGDSGKEWYDSAMKRVRSAMSTRYPDIVGDTEWDFFLAILATTSPGLAPKVNLPVAISVYDKYVNTGKIPIKNEKTGKAYSIPSTANLTRFSAMLSKYGKSGLVQLLNGVSTTGELNAIGGNISGQHDEAAFNSMLLGEKVGMFYQSMRGTAGAVAVDRWAIRSFYRWTGALESQGSSKGFGNDTDNIRDIVSPEDRRNVEYVMQTVGERLKLSGAQVQAVMWYYEKRLYKKLGLGKLVAETDDFAVTAEKMFLNKSISVSDIQTLFSTGKMPTFNALLQAIMGVTK